MIYQISNKTPLILYNWLHQHTTKFERLSMYTGDFKIFMQNGPILEDENSIYQNLRGFCIPKQAEQPLHPLLLKGVLLTTNMIMFVNIFEHYNF